MLAIITINTESLLHLKFCVERWVNQAWKTRSDADPAVMELPACRRPSVNPCYCCSVAQVCLTLCDPTDHPTPGFPVLH